MIYPDIDAQEWARKYGLEEKEYRCPKCKGAFKTTVPVVTSDCAGLASVVHGCGPGYVGYVLTPRKPEAEAFWRQVLS